MVNNRHEHLASLGMVRPVAGGIQVDVNAVISGLDAKSANGSLCDHNCTSEHGHYTCPSALSLNQRALKKSLAPAENILKGIKVAIQGVRISLQKFLNESFAPYCERFKIPDDIALVFKEVMETSPIEVNLSGGNPEIHPEIIDIISDLNQWSGIVTNLTTTGRRIMREPVFLDHLLNNPPDIVSFSADDFEDVAQIRTLRNKTPEQLYERWRQIPKSCGQRQKAIEAICAASLLIDAGKPDINFNLVVHSGNLGYADVLISELNKSFPGTHVFPYPSQTAFLYEKGNVHDRFKLEQFIDRMIDAHREDILPITRRLHYWLMLKAVCVLYGANSQVVVDMIGGHKFWQCYKSSLSNRYLQISNKKIFSNRGIGGGYLGCGWNHETVNGGDVQIWDMDPEDVADHISSGANMNALLSANQCTGCAFPRLMFDVVNSELGLNDTLVPAYLELRYEYAGY